MTQHDPYDAWRHARAQVDVPPQFADAVMDAVRKTDLKPPPSRFGRRADQPALAARVFWFVVDVLLWPVAKVLDWLGGVGGSASRAAKEGPSFTRYLLRINLRPGAADFQQFAIEPGVGMLDPTGANYTILRKWLGNLIAEPEWLGETVLFFVRDDNGRVSEVESRLASRSDLTGPLRGEFAAIGQRLAEAKPVSVTEQTLHRLISQQYRAVAERLDDRSLDCSSMFVRYRERKGKWHLAMCWGYQRTDQQPAQALICGHADCNQLFVQRDEGPAICPACRRPAV